MNPKLTTFTHKNEFIQTATQAIESAIIEAQQKRGEAHVAVSGGKSPGPIYQALSQSEQINWGELSLWLVDERYVPADHEESNQQMIQENFGSRIERLKAFHFFDTKLSPDESAKVYATELGNRPEPLFDLVLLGLGEDGHTASLFPSIPELNQSERLAVPTWAEGYTTPQRLTLTFATLLSSREILFMIEGQKKEKVLQSVLHQSSPSPRLPASFVLRHPQLSFYFLNT